MIRVMVAEDNIDFNSMCCNYLAKDKDIEVISQTLDGESTLMKYLELKPDALLLDLDIPKLNGLEIINTLSLDTNEKHKCNIIVVSGSTDLCHNLYNTSKVYRIMPKPANLDDILLTIKELSPKVELSNNKIRNFLFNLKFNLYSKGSIYLVEAIKLAYKEPILLCDMKKLYSRLGNKYNVNPIKIQWSIRNSIELLNKNISIDVLHSIFHIYGNETLTPKYFFTATVEYLNNEYQFNSFYS